MVEITFVPEKLSLSFHGHADYAEKGKDIVCSAVSTLFYTLVSSLEEMGCELDVKAEEGDSYVECVAMPPIRGHVMQTYWTILVGLQMLAEQYPENICFNVENEG